MSMTAASIELANALKTVRTLWEEVRLGWRDSVAHDFEVQRWDPLVAAVEGSIQAMDRLAPIIARAVRDCS
jgi:hypothetical protein